ncbi:MAG: CD1871A family CXXC motif-containing protein [Candidatus Ratteibacteria bacterium]|nr:CD1871A family CXXC motif-containing protein [Candidatus Ratteibacteria bacterium]
MKNKITYILLSISVLLMIIGVLQGEFLEVMQKAIIICLSCMGIG